MTALTLFETLLQDARFAARVLRRSPGFTLTAVLTLAVAIAMNTAVFSVVDAVLFRPLPYPAPERLALVETSATGTETRTDTAQHGVTWITIREHAATVDRAVFSSWTSGANLLAGDRATYVEQQRVGSGFFRVLGVAPVAGRDFTEEEDRRGGPAVAVLSHHVWRDALGADPSIVGRTLSLRGEPHTIVGVMPSGFDSGVKADLWTPLRAGTDGEGEGENYHILLRLKDGVSWQQARDEVARLGREVLRQRPAPAGVTHTHSIVPLQAGLTEPLRRPLMLLWAAVALVLLVASVNLAGLMLSAGARRTREIATRLAIGGTRAAVLRQLIVESTLVAILGTSAGIALSVAAIDTLQDVAKGALDVRQAVAIDWRSAVAAAVLGAFATTVFGVIPAIYATRRDVQRTLAEWGTRGIAGSATYRGRRALIVAQVAGAVVLLVGAGLLLRTFVHLRGLDPGFDAQHVTAATVSLQDSRYRTAGQVTQLVNSALMQLQQNPRVVSAAVSLGLPYERLLNLGFRHLDGPEASATRGRMTSATYVAGDYFGALKVPVRAGRTFDTRDQAGSSGVVIVNETFARQYFEGHSPVGRRIAFAGREREIIGVVGDVQVRPGWGDKGPLAPMPLSYIPLAQASDPMLRLVHGWFATAFIVRMADRGDGQGTVRAAMAAADPQLPIAKVRTMREVQSAAVALPWLLMTLLVTLAAAAVLLVALGIHGLISATVTERTREMGIRMALGASAARTIRTLIMPAILLVAGGTAVGALLARAATGVVRHFVWGISTTDPVTFAGVAVLLVAIAAAASLVPAVRILRLDPAQTLRDQ